jgi:carbamoyltransferase
MNIISVNFGVHDSSACILSNGEVETYYKEERLSRIKRDVNPKLAIKQCLNDFKGKIDCATVISYPSCSSNDKKLIANLANVSEQNIHEYSYFHHLSHAALAFYNSGFEESLIVVIDGQGSIYTDGVAECESVYLAKYPCSFECVIKNVSVNKEHSHLSGNGTVSLDRYLKKHKEYECNINPKEGGIVNVYNTATVLMSQSVLENGKTMGLSSYGKKGDYPSFFNEKSQPNWDLFTEDSSHSRLYNSHKDKVIGTIKKDNYKFYADYAYEVQSQTQDTVVNLIKRAIEKTGCKNVCMVGGYAMNIVANHYYLQQLPDVKFYFEPNADDGGLPIGAAKHFHHERTNDETKRPIVTTAFHGKTYDLTTYRSKTTTLQEIARLLHQNNSVAVYKGLAEAGQRALGNRSIFFNPLHPNAKEIVNKIKKREWYRPFAGIVLEEDADLFFDMGVIKSSPHMTISFPVKTDLIPGITHIDGTCRIQTTSKEDGYLYELIKEFKKLSGVGIILNTSFNLAGEPLVETPDDAVKTLKNSDLNYLWFEETNQLFTNKKLSSMYS